METRKDLVTRLLVTEGKTLDQLSTQDKGEVFSLYFLFGTSSIVTAGKIKKALGIDQKELKRLVSVGTLTTQPSSNGTLYGLVK